MEERNDEDMIIDILVRITLYQFGHYDAEKLERDLDKFLRYAEEKICKALAPNGAVCFKYYADEYGIKEAEKLLENDIWNWEISQAPEHFIHTIKVSKEVYFAIREPNYDLNKKILLVDKVIHLQHWGGHIFNANIPEVKRVADEIVRAVLETKKEFLS